MASWFPFLSHNMAPALLSPYPFYLLLLLLLCTIAQTSQEIPLGSSLTADDQNTSWASPSNEFAFGFFRLPSNDLFLLAIWFNKLPDRTVVWSANRDDPVQRGSKVSLTNDGRLALFDHLDQEKWSTPKSTDERDTSASMLDNGNFVLLGKNKNSPYVWESFHEPTDTILPRQILSKPSKLSSRRTETDYSMGRFQLRLQTDGNLVLYTIAQPTEFAYDAYWSSNTVGSGSQVVFNESGYVSLTQSNGTATINLTPGDIISTENFYHRLTLDFDGILRQYVYPKSSQSRWAQSWSDVWYEPSDMCTAVFSWLGSGICGYNSYCRLDINQKPSCECPPGYSLVDPNNTFGDCKQEFVPQSCELGGLREQNQFELRELRNVDWPLADYEKYQPINEDLCRQVCLEDCFCDVAVFNDDTCWKKKMPLSNGRMGPSVSRKTFIKVPKINYSIQSFIQVPKINSSIQSPTASCRSKRKRTALIIAGSVLIASSGILNVILLIVSLVLFYAYRRRNSTNAGPNTSMLGKRIRFFTYRELEQATDRFKEELGRGAFGAVYKGVLAWDSRHVVAVKKLDGPAMVGEADGEFKTEVIAIGQTHHKNLARLLGFCNEGLHRLLVFEFMSNGSLASFLFGSKKPDWNQRVQIALGVAWGLVYLHQECSTQIIHCDITPHSILLDESFAPRISDFGLAKLMKADQTSSITSIRGTRGYVAPEWFRNMPVTTKVDVYSFGVLLLEIICCRQNVEMSLENEERMILTDWAYDCYAEKRMNLLVDNDEDALNDMKRVERLIMVAIWCIQEDPTMRPSMDKVAEMLEGAVEVHSPPSPSLLSSFTG